MAQGPVQPLTQSPDPVTRILNAPKTLTLLVLIGVALRVWAYAGNTALYLDEILLSHSILNIPMKELLTQPLPLDQVAPLGFLFIERLCVVLLGGSELVLRLFPFLVSLISVLLFRRLAEHTLAGTAPALALFLFSVGFPFIRYAATVKQYELDATVAILLLLIAVELRTRPATSRKLLLYGLVGFVLIWFSQGSVLVMAGLGLALAVDWLSSRSVESQRALLFTIPLWAAASLVAVLMGFRSMTPSTRQFMNEFWGGGFAPSPLHVPAFLTWLWKSALEFFSDPTLLRYRWPVVFVLISLLGVAALWRQKRSVALLLLGPFVLALLAAIAHQYPFRGRLAVWSVPFAILALAAGAEFIGANLARAHYLAGAAAIVLILVVPVLALAEAPPPYEIDRPRELLGYLQQHRKPGDVVYVFPPPGVATRFHGPRFGLARQEWTISACDRNETRPYIKDIDRFRGTPRFWILMGGGVAFGPARSAVSQYLSTIGTKLDSLSLSSATYGTVGIELYDLSDPARLGQATADSFPAPTISSDPRPGCRPWIRQWPGE